MALRRVVDAAMMSRRWCETSSCLHLEPAVSARSMLSRREALSMKVSPGVMSLHLNRGKSMSTRTYPIQDAVDRSGTATVPHHRPDIKVPLPLQPQNPHAGGWLTGTMAASPATVEVLVPQHSTCTMSHPYHTHPFPSRRFLNGLPLPHTGGTPPPPPPRKKSEKGKEGPAVSARACQGKCILTSCECNMYLPRLRRPKLALLSPLSPPRVSLRPVGRRLDLDLGWLCVSLGKMHVFGADRTSSARFTRT